MAYAFFIAGVQMPVPPPELRHSIPGRNVTYDLINGEQINILKGPGLREYSFELLLPQVKYPWAIYPKSLIQGEINVADFLSKSYDSSISFDSEGYAEARMMIPPLQYLQLFEYLKAQKMPFQLDIYRELPTGEQTWCTQQTVSMENYEVVESADEGFDLKVSINLKEYNFYGTQRVSLRVGELSYSVIRPTNRTVAHIVEVKSGDTLWTIAQSAFGNCEQVTVDYLYEVNKKIIDEANSGKDVDKFTVHRGQKLKTYDATIGTINEYRERVGG